MIESSFLSTSPWDSDLLQDLGPIPDVSPFDFEQFSFELDNNEIFALSGSSSPVDLCSSSSDNDYMLIDELDKIFPVSDTFVSQILEDHTVTGFSDLDWLTSTDASKQYNETENTSTVSEGTAFRGDPFDWILGTKLWSRMTPADQLNTLHALSDIVTYHMGLKEQIEIIRVIDPSAKISAEDKEFPLDSTNLNDAKLRKIKECIRKFRHSLQSSSHRSNFSSLKETTKKSSNCTKIVSRKTNNLKYSRTKRKQKKQKVMGETPEKQKRLKQSKKELKSGFFVYEKKMKLISPLEEDEDVNILE